jgi:ribonuclease VapC
MVLDSSAVVALLCMEAESTSLEMAIERSPRRLMSVASVLETAIVMEGRFGPEGARELDLLIDRLRITLVPVDLEQLIWAREAFHRFGKGRHRAALNYGDCFSYALAKWSNEPLLFLGGDFSQTDIGDARTA